MQVKTLKTFRWKTEMPEFKENSIYDLDENLALEMIKHGYAEKVEIQLENKMVDTSSKSGEIKITKRAGMPDFTNHKPKRGRKPKK